MFNDPILTTLYLSVVGIAFRNVYYATQTGRICHYPDPLPTDVTRVALVADVIGGEADNY